MIGGTSILAGEGAIWRTVLGVLLLTLIGNGFNLLNLDPIYQQIFQGALILAAVAIDQLLRRGLSVPRGDRRRRHVHGLGVPAPRSRDGPSKRSSLPRSDTTPPDFEQGVLDVIPQVRRGSTPTSPSWRMGRRW